MFAGTAVRCVAAAIRDNSGKVRGALSVAGPAYRLTLERLELLGPELAEAARRVGAQLNETQIRIADGEVEMVESPWAFNGAFPRWSETKQCLFWADTLAPTIRQLDASGERVFARLDAPVCAMELHEEGLLIAHTQGLLLLDHEGKQHPLPGWPGKNLMGLSSHPGGGLCACLVGHGGYRVGELSAEGELRTPWSFQERISARCWDEQGESLYAVALESGSLYLMSPGNPNVRRFATLPKGSGRLSGMALDRDGGVWTTLRDGWSLVRFSEDGGVDAQCAVRRDVPGRYRLQLQSPAGSPHAPRKRSHRPASDAGAGVRIRRRHPAGIRPDSRQPTRTLAPRWPLSSFVCIDL